MFFREQDHVGDSRESRAEAKRLSQREVLSAPYAPKEFALRASKPVDGLHRVAHEIDLFPAAEPALLRHPRHLAFVEILRLVHQ